MNICGKKVVLRAIEKKDSDLICEMFNDPEIEHLVVGWSFPISKEHQDEWIDTHQNNERNQRFVIETKKDGALGIASLTEIDWKNRTAVFGIKLANKKNRRKGIGTDVLMAVEKYVFDELCLHRLETSILTDNIASIGLFKKCGWKKEGIKKSSVFKDGVWKDLLITRILEDEYRKEIKKNKYWD